MTNKDKNELVVTRIIDSPREVVWKAWTKPECLMRWWGPKGFTSPIYKIDFHVGGEYINCMQSPDGQDICGKGVFREIVAQEKLVMTDSFVDLQGNVVPATYYGLSSEFPLEMLITVIFEEQDRKTKLTIIHSGIEGISDMDRINMKQGWDESLDKLVEILTKK